MQCAAAYIFQGQIVLAAERETTAGVWISDGPVQVYESTDPMILGQAVLGALAASRRATPHPTDWKSVANPVPAAAGAKSHKAFMASAKHVTVEAKGSQVIFRPSRNLGAKEGFEPSGVEQTSSTDPDDVGRLLLASFRSAT